jgi:hypothetical protein
MQASSPSRPITDRQATTCRTVERRIVGRQLALCGSPAVRTSLSALTLSLRPQRKADDDEGQAKQQADHHHAPVGRFVRVVKRRTMACFPQSHPYRNVGYAQRDLGFNLTE